MSTGAGSGPVVLELQPTLLNEEELRREVAEDPSDRAEFDAVRNAIRELVRAGLLNRNRDLVLPTRAAVRIKELFGLIVWVRDHDRQSRSRCWMLIVCRR